MLGEYPPQHITGAGGDPVGHLQAATTPHRNSPVQPGGFDRGALWLISPPSLSYFMVTGARALEWIFLVSFVCLSLFSGVDEDIDTG